MKEATELLKQFFSAIEHDPRISISHIGLFTTLVLCWEKQGCLGPITIYSKELMIPAKISSCTTYVKLINELDRYGYIKYSPSFYKRRGSEIVLQIIQSKMYKPLKLTKSDN